MSAFMHHWSTVRRALDEERARTVGRLRSSEPDFLPAALEIVERPVSPTARASAWLLIAGLAVALGWLVFGRVDIVASAQGRIMPTDDVKLVQASNTGIVRRIYVHEGDRVRRGQALIDLDPTVSTAGEVQAQRALEAAELDVARGKAITQGLSGMPVAFALPAGTSPEVADTQRRLVNAQIALAAAQSEGLAASRRSAQSDASAAAAQMRAFDDTIPVLDRELDAMNGLAAKGYAPGLKLLELQRQLRSEAGSREVAAAQRDHSLSDADKFSRQIAEAREQARQTALTDLAKAENEVMLRREEVTKAHQRSQMQRLLAPVDGTVQQVSVHTLGGVVEAVRPLMIVVPDGGLLVEARVQNKDAGFVRQGQAVAVKLDAFPFTRYGTIPGRIISVSHDAVQDAKLGSYYVARITLTRRTIKTEDGIVPLSAGLNTTSDIKIGSRSIGAYLLSPLSSGVAEAGRER